MRIFPKRILWIGVLLILAGHSPAFADPHFSTGCLIQYTPFYNRLLSAGIFDPIIRSSIPFNQAQPMQMLFRMARSFHYTSDRKHDLWQSAEETSKNYGGDCEDKAIWLYTKMRQNGYQNVSLVIGKYGPNSREFHMWVTYKNESGENLLLDPTIQRKPWKIDAFPKRLYHPIHILSGDNCVSL